MTPWDLFLYALAVCFAIPAALVLFLGLLFLGSLGFAFLVTWMDS